MKLTQTQRVIAAAKSYRGVTQVDFLGTHTIDGGPPITRVAARIQDARDEGHEFENLGTRQSCKVYRWVSGPELTDLTASEAKIDKTDEVEVERGGGGRSPGQPQSVSAPNLPTASLSPTLFDLSTAEPHADTAHWKAA